jgi:dipeptidyl aminopeptidase/acylaminoacyl peptidase
MRPTARRVLLALALSLLPFAPEANAQTPKRGLALEDYYRLKEVGAPRISPDGRWVAYTVSTPIERTNADAVETWLVRADGTGEPVRIEHAGLNVSDPLWQTDGRLRFTSGDARYSIDPARPDAAALAMTPIVNSSPDGRLVASTREVPRDAKPSPSLSDFERRHEARFKGEQFDWWPIRRNAERFPVPDGKAREPTEIFVASLDGSDGSPAKQLTQLGLQASAPRWRPDGRALLFTTDDAVAQNELAYASSDLFLVTTDGALTRLTDDGFAHSSADFSPDGKWISYVRSTGSDMVIEQKLDQGGPVDVYVRPAGGGEARNLTASWDLDPGSQRWSPDSRWLYLTAEVGGASHLFRVAADGGPVQQVTSGERQLQRIDFDRALRRITYLVGELDRPADVWVADIDGKNERRLTDVNRELLAEVELGARPAERVLYKSYDGTPIEGFLVFPRGYDPARGPYPMIVESHGGPHAASGYDFSFKHQMFAANGYFVFFPNFRSSTGYGDAFKWATWGAWGTKDGEDVVAGVDHLLGLFPIDRARVGATGHSYGGFMTNWLITRYPDRFAAAVTGAGISNWTSNYALSDVARTKETEFFGPPWDAAAREIMIRQSPYFNAGGAKTPTLFVHGSVDYRVPLEDGIQLYTALKKQGVPTKMIIYEGMPHGISGHWNQVHRAMHELRWWETYLKPVKKMTQEAAR